MSFAVPVLNVHTKKGGVKYVYYSKGNKVRDAVWYQRETDSGSACRRTDSCLFVSHMRVKDMSVSTTEVCLVSTSVHGLFDLLINIH